MWIVSLLAASAFLVSSTPGSPDAILTRIDRIVEDEAAKSCRAAGLNYPPQATLMRVFKKERQLEIWAKNDGMEEMHLVRTLHVCAVDAVPGPKLKPYDRKTPEGFYNLNFAYCSRYPWMWIKLEQEHLDEYGVVGDGSCFQMPLSYPNPVDRAHTVAAGSRVPRPEISMHGNCVTAGCVSLENRDFIFVFAFARHHQAKSHGRLQLHIFPFRFDREWSLDDDSASYKHRKAFGDAHLRRFWENLEEGFKLFDRIRNPLEINYGPTFLRKGDRSPDVARVKKVMLKKGLYRGPIDEVFDEPLRKAVVRFQSRYLKNPRGEIGPATLRRLGLRWRKRYVFRQ